MWASFGQRPIKVIPLRCFKGKCPFSRGKRGGKDKKEESEDRYKKIGREKKRETEASEISKRWSMYKGAKGSFRTASRPYVFLPKKVRKFVCSISPA